MQMFVRTIIMYVIPGNGGSKNSSFSAIHFRTKIACLNGFEINESTEILAFFKFSTSFFFHFSRNFFFNFAVSARILFNFSCLWAVFILFASANLSA